MSAFSLPPPPRKTYQRLFIVVGDQLDPDSESWHDFNPQYDLIIMAEVAEEAMVVWSHKARISVFLSAMRHFAVGMATRGWPLHYYAIDQHDFSNLADVWRVSMTDYAPQTVVAQEMGDWRLEQLLQQVCTEKAVTLHWRDDSHFICSRTSFTQWARGKKHWLMEHFYRDMRKKTGYLMQVDQPAKPLGDQWNYDESNRASFGRQGPSQLPPLPVFTPDAITQDVMALVQQRFADHPGTLTALNWPVTPADATIALNDFIEHRLPYFGQFQDAMWQDQAFLYHSLLSVALNLKLLNPRVVIQAAEKAYYQGHATLSTVEGFIRQILGWREFIRGVYWQSMPALEQANYLAHQHPLPQWYWTGNTKMNCLRQTIQQTLNTGYAHHIQRLMITGNFALIAGIQPHAVSAWYRAIYVDAVAWVEMPNTLGMALYANGGQFTSKPYVASGAYIKRMSNYCQGCAYRPEIKTGSQACPFTNFYWDFLIRHEARFKHNHRMGLMLKNLQRLSVDEKEAIQHQALLLRQQLL